MTTQSDWIKWNGGECPVTEETRVEVKFRNGETSTERGSTRWNWRWFDADSTIIAYRVLDAKAGDRS